jgi:sugar phosphate isomerase/epimerase
VEVDVNEQIPPVALQLYTLREQAEIDFVAVLQRVGEIGYVGVELAAFHGLSPAELRRTLDAAGLRISSGHVGWSTPTDFAAAVDVHLEIGCDFIVVPFFAPDAFESLDAVARAADALNEANAVAREHGATLGYHNHWWELEHVLEGRPALLHLFDRVDPDVLAEVDIYWAQVGGQDPVEVVSQLGARVGLLHVKDGPADGPQSAMVAVGDGVIDVPRVLEASPSARWHIVELDRCDTDMFDAVARSYSSLVGTGLSQGRA